MSKRGDETRDRIYTEINNYIKKNGFSPTYREISELVNISVSTIHRHMTIMEKDGRIIYLSRSSRAFTTREFKGLLDSWGEVEVISRDGDIPNLIRWKGLVYTLGEG